MRGRYSFRAKDIAWGKWSMPHRLSPTMDGTGLLLWLMSELL